MASKRIRTTKATREMIRRTMSLLGSRKKTMSVEALEQRKNASQIAAAKRAARKAYEMRIANTLAPGVPTETDSVK